MNTVRPTTRSLRLSLWIALVAVPSIIVITAVLCRRYGSPVFETGEIKRGSTSHPGRLVSEIIDTELGELRRDLAVVASAVYQEATGDPLWTIPAEMLSTTQPSRMGFTTLLVVRAGGAIAARWDASNKTSPLGSELFTNAPVIHDSDTATLIHRGSESYLAVAVSIPLVRPEKTLQGMVVGIIDLPALLAKTSSILQPLFPGDNPPILRLTTTEGLLLGQSEGSGVRSSDHSSRDQTIPLSSAPGVAVSYSAGDAAPVPDHGGTSFPGMTIVAVVLGIAGYAIARHLSRQVIDPAADAVRRLGDIGRSIQDLTQGLSEADQTIGSGASAQAQALRQGQLCLEKLHDLTGEETSIAKQALSHMESARKATQESDQLVGQML